MSILYNGKSRHKKGKNTFDLEHAVLSLFCTMERGERDKEGEREFLTAGGLRFLSLWVNSSYRTTPKLQTSDATENLLSVRDSGAYLHTQAHKHS